MHKRNLRIDQAKTYGHQPFEHKDISKLINHDYMNNFTRRIQEKSNRIRQDNRDKLEKLKNYSNYKRNNTVLKRNSEIKKKYLTSRDINPEPSMSFFSPRKDVGGLYGKMQTPMKNDFMISTTRPS